MNQFRFRLVAGVGFEPHDLRVMSPTSYQAAPPRDIWCRKPGSNRYEIKSHGILSPGRLPIPPFRHTNPASCLLIISFRMPFVKPFSKKSRFGFPLPTSILLTFLSFYATISKKFSKGSRLLRARPLKRQPKHAGISKRSQRGGLENRLGATPRGFESLCLRQKQNDTLVVSFCFFMYLADSPAMRA